MSAETQRTDVNAPSVVKPKVNTLSIVAISLVALAVTGTAVRSWAPVFAGLSGLAVFAIGLGHVALQQIRVRRERGAILAYIALGVTYLYATLVVILSVYSGVVYIRR